MEFQVGEHKYRSRRLNAFDQLFITKRLVGSMKEIVQNPGEEGRFFETLATAIGKVSDEDLTFIITKCCAVCDRFQNGQWFPVVSAAGTFMYQDLSSVGFLKIAYEVIQENLSGFFEELRSILDLDLVEPPKSS